MQEGMEEAAGMAAVRVRRDWYARRYMPSPERQRGTVVLLGEVLFDVFPEGREVLGGAPFNVAWHLAGFGLEPLLLSRVGRDDPGRRVRAALAAWGLDASGLQEDPDLPTGRVEVQLDAGPLGEEPRFNILPDRAWDRLDAASSRRTVESLASPPVLLYQGTLAQRSPASREALAEVRRATGAPVFLDVNLRPPWVLRERTEAALERARWAKVSAGELEEIHGQLLGRRLEDVLEAGRDVRRRWDLEVLIVTRGKHGATWIAADGAVSRAPEPVGTDPDGPDSTADSPGTDSPGTDPAGNEPGGGRIVDTVGAGDALSAVAILGLLRGWNPALTLQRGVDFAAEICRHHGATPREPELYRRWRERFEDTAPERPGAGRAFQDQGFDWQVRDVREPGVRTGEDAGEEAGRGAARGAAADQGSRATG